MTASMAEYKTFKIKQQAHVLSLERR